MAKKVRLFKGSEFEIEMDTIDDKRELENQEKTDPIPYYSYKRMIAEIILLLITIIVVLGLALVLFGATEV